MTDRDGDDWAAAYLRLPRLVIDEGRRGSAFPFSEAAAFSLQSVRLRMGRMLIVVVGVALATAFMTALLVMGDMLRGVEKLFEVEAQPDDFGRWWLLVALLISITGITNAMLMSVTERVKEIGTLKCLGATWLHILEIFLCESAFLGLVGGVRGGVLGVALAALNVTAQFGSEALTLVSARTAAFGVGAGAALAVVMCLVSSIYPVCHASRIQAAEALRYEV
jgi:hypothetical protein